MSDKYFEDQFDDEEVLYVFRKHPIVMRKGLVFGMFGPLIGVLPATFWPQLGFGWFFGGMALGIVLGMLIMMPYWIQWYFSVCIVTSQRFIQIRQKGLFNRSVGDISLNHIQTMNYEVIGFEETVFGFGTIVIQTYMGDLVITDVHHPAKTQKRILNILKDLNIEPVNYPEPEMEQR